MLYGNSTFRTPAPDLIERTPIGTNGASLTAVGVYYGPLGGYVEAASVSLPDRFKVAWRTGGSGTHTFRSLRVNLSANSWSTGCEVALYVNGSKSALTTGVITPTTLTGQDLTNSVTVSDGDLVEIGVELITGGSGTVFMRGCTVSFETSSGTQIYKMLAGSIASPTTTAGARFLRAAGLFAGQTTEANAYMRALEACTLSHMQVYCSAAGAAAMTVKSRVNGPADGNQTITTTASTPGLYEAPSGSDTLAVNDTFDVNRQATGANYSVTMCAFKYAGAVSKRSMICAGGQSTTVGAGATVYGAIFGGVAVGPNSTTQANAQQRAPCSGDITALSVHWNANASTADVTMQLQVNGSDVGNPVTIPNLVAQGFATLAVPATVSVVADDLVNVIFTGATTGAVTVDWIGALFTSTGP